MNHATTTVTSQLRKGFATLALLALATATTAAIAAGVPPAAHSAFPGQNGKIAFTRHYYSDGHVEDLRRKRGRVG